MDETTRTSLNNLRSENRELQNTAFFYMPQEVCRSLEDTHGSYA